MKCSCCGEEVGNVSVCPICGTGMAPAPTPVAAAPVAGAASHAAPAPTVAHMSGADLFDRCVNGVLEIYIIEGKTCFSGSGYLVNNEGYAVTNSHVVVNNGKVAGECMVSIAGEKVRARVIQALTKSDFTSNKDLALIRLEKVPAKARPICFGDSSKVRTGENIYIIGNSLGRGTLMTRGIISDNDREGQFMYDSATNGGNSGGPVFNEDGCVIATHVAGSLSNSGEKNVQGMNIGIPCTYAKALLTANRVDFETD